MNSVKSKIASYLSNYGCLENLSPDRADELCENIHSILSEGQEPVGYLFKKDYSFISFKEAQREMAKEELENDFIKVFSSPVPVERGVVEEVRRVCTSTACTFVGENNKYYDSCPECGGFVNRIESPAPTLTPPTDSKQNEANRIAKAIDERASIKEYNDKISDANFRMGTSYKLLEYPDDNHVPDRKVEDVVETVRTLWDYIHSIDGGSCLRDYLNCDLSKGEPDAYEAIKLLTTLKEKI